ncbi:hypothetical protein [Xenorhabdus khoisanae]|uniref:hypothetical protein n=1 Tax=Xenorhabdus khoisanae TaxID=880157 RepID=UPI00235994BC|nr:hypothetical protein [Xenorhabdus khoisanae]
MPAVTGNTEVLEVIAVANSINTLVATSCFRPSNEGEKMEVGDKKGHTEVQPNNQNVVLIRLFPYETIRQ